MDNISLATVGRIAIVAVATIVGLAMLSPFLGLYWAFINQLMPMDHGIPDLDGVARLTYLAYSGTLRLLPFVVAGLGVNAAYDKAKSEFSFLP